MLQCGHKSALTLITSFIARRNKTSSYCVSDEKFLCLLNQDVQDDQHTPVSVVFSFSLCCEIPWVKHTFQRVATYVSPTSVALLFSDEGTVFFCWLIVCVSLIKTYKLSGGLSWKSLRWRQPNILYFEFYIFTSHTCFMVWRSVLRISAAHHLCWLSLSAILFNHSNHMLV